MSQEKAEIVRRVYDALSKGELDRSLEMVADDIVFDFSNSMSDAKAVYRGKQEVRELYSFLYEPFNDSHWSAEEVIEVDDSTVVVVTRVEMRGRSSGANVDVVTGLLWTFAENRARKVTMYQTKDEALEAAGLRE